MKNVFIMLRGAIWVLFEAIDVFVFEILQPRLSPRRKISVVRGSFLSFFIFIIYKRLWEG